MRFHDSNNLFSLPRNAPWRKHDFLIPPIYYDIFNSFFHYRTTHFHQRRLNLPWFRLEFSFEGPSAPFIFATKLDLFCAEIRNRLYASRRPRRVAEALSECSKGLLLRCASCEDRHGFCVEYKKGVLSAGCEQAKQKEGSERRLSELYLKKFFVSNT